MQTTTQVDKPMLKAVFWTVIVLAALITGLGFGAARKSTGMTAPSVSDGTLPPCSNKPNCVTSEINPEHKAYIKPITEKITIKQLQTHIESLNGEVTRTSDSLIQAEFRTPLFGFTDDLLVMFDETDSVFKIRSSSRIGHSDLGANRKRIEALHQLINNQSD